ncbi:MAG: tRNA guanosine(15) transglycosylase TgtA [Candidatus Diapherotrites archaeon]|nr:tRNA guanosine(15) transglycosylase TgtA [Candidatus Diapherotrites archaeon]
MLEILQKDLGARIARFKTRHGKIETPTILPVINPLTQTIHPKKIKKMGAQAIITNAYILWKHRREEAVKKGAHKLIGFDGPIMTDSGAFQFMQYGSIDVTNREIIRFQQKMDVDIGVFLDVPGLGTKKQVEANCKETLKRAREAKAIIDSERLWAGPIQGAQYLDIRTKHARQMARLNFDIYPIGTVVPFMNNYEFALNIDIIAAVKQNIPLNKPVHHFGAGHPMFFAFAVAMGCDIFDSAAYALFAKKGKYMTVSGTYDINNMKYLPCSCPVCSSHSPDEMDEELLAKHNLYITFEEMDRIKQSIYENTLWELLEERARAHPMLYEAFKRMKRYAPFIEKLDPITKKRFFVLSHESSNRIEVYRHSKKRLKSRRYVNIPPFKDVPCEVLNMYPFGQIVPKPDVDIDVQGIDEINAIFEYIYGVKNIFPKNVRIERSKKTGRIRAIYSKDGELLATMRASDYLPILHNIAHRLYKKTKHWRVAVSEDAIPFVSKGKNVFAKFVRDADKGIRAGMDVLIVDEKGTLIATGRAMLSAYEMLDFDRGVAVSTRKTHQ